MEYQQFLETIKELNIHFRSDNGYEANDYSWMRSKSDSVKRDYIHEDWIVGGMAGGNCWGDNADRSVTAEEEPEFEYLDVILSIFCPNITFLNYKQKILPLIKTEDYQQNEYYGNYYDKRRKIIFLDELYEVVKELNQW